MGCLIHQAGTPPGAPRLPRHVRLHLVPRAVAQRVPVLPLAPGAVPVLVLVLVLLVTLLLITLVLPRVPSTQAAIMSSA